MENPSQIATSDSSKKTSNSDLVKRSDVPALATAVRQARSTGDSPTQLFSEPGAFVKWQNPSGYTGIHDTGRYWRESGAPERHKQKIRDRHAAEGPWGDEYRRLKPVALAGKMIVLLGKRGTGKTQMAVDLLADICATGEMVKYLKVMDLFREIRSCYRKDGPSEVETVDRMCKTGGLVIDEAHERSDSDWENRTLTNIIDRRYDDLKTTILVSNMTRETFGEAMGPSFKSRMQECGNIIVCDWPSFRGQG